MLTRGFTRREKVLLVVLALALVAGLYVLLIQRPVNAKLETLAVEQEELEQKIEISTLVLAQYTEMKQELDEIFALPADQVTVMPPYDNLETLMVQFDSIFMGLEPKLSFSEVRFEEGIATRPIVFEFEAPSYDEARAILTRLTRTGQRSLLEGLAIEPVEGSASGQSIQQGAVRVTGTIYFYELAPVTADQSDEGAGG